MNNYNSNYQTLLGSQGSVSGPFGEIGRVRNTPYNQYRTVFNDIADEWGNCSEEERRFIEQDSEYIQANVVYAQQFNSFLLDQFGLQFANSKYGDSAEKVLISLKNARGRFRTSTIEDVAKIKNENLQLQKQIKELEDLINGVS
jgi:hypothetical protein